MTAREPGPDAAPGRGGASPARPATGASAADPQHRPVATSLWLEAPGRYALRENALPEPGHGEVRIEAMWSAVSRGTERLVMEGRVPAAEAERMRCPHQAGAFPFPVKYGYALVGRTTDGRIVFALHPHQSAAVVAGSALVVVPDGVPPRRATLAANMETALNVVWDSGAGPGDRVLVAGAGVVGLLAARLLARMPGVAVALADVDPARRAVAEALGASFVAPEGVPADVDVAINASGTDAGLRTCIAAAGVEARVVEASWHGTGRAAVDLGGAFHSRRLTIVSSQVGRVPAARAPRWTHARRLGAAMSLLADPALDALLTHTVRLDDAPARLPALIVGGDALAIVIDYAARPGA